MLATYEIGAGLQLLNTSKPLGCANFIGIPEGNPYEPSYAATAVKWAGAWTENYTLFVA